MKPCGDPIVDGLCAKMERDAQGDMMVHRVIGKLKARSEAGQRKYGVTLARTDLTHLDWLHHAQMEAMDGANYLEVLILRLGPGTRFDDMQEMALATACELEARISEIEQTHQGPA